MIESNTNKEDALLPIIDENNSFTRRSPFIQIPERDSTTDEKALIEMGFNEVEVNKVYLFLKPRNINEAIEYMTEINGIIQHDYYSNTDNDNQCFICKKDREHHINYYEDSIEISENFNIGFDDLNDTFDLMRLDNINVPAGLNHFNNICSICFTLLTKSEKVLLKCGHCCCKICLFFYLQSEIKAAKVDKIKCFQRYCLDVIAEDIIINSIQKDKPLLEKYNIFKQRAIIFNSQDKKFCPEPDCNSYLQEDLTNKYVQCENGHKYCYICLKPWHGESKCDEKLDKDFQIWKKDKVVKRCPRCKIYTEKNEGCNHMTCTECKYQWCWLCEGEYQDGHFKTGQCNGLQFAKINYLSEKKERKVPDLNDPYRSREVNSDNSDGCCICDNNIPDKLYHVWLTHEGMLYHGHPVLSFIVSFTVFVFCVYFIVTVAWFFNVFDDDEKIARKKYLRVFIILVGIMQCAAFLIQSTFVMILFCFFSIFFRGNNWFKRVHEYNTKHFTYNITAYRNVME